MVKRIEGKRVDGTRTHRDTQMHPPMASTWSRVTTTRACTAVSSALDATVAPAWNVSHSMVDMPGDFEMKESDRACPRTRGGSSPAAP